MESSLPPHVVSSLLRQLKQLAQSPPEGVKFVPGEGLEEIFADIEGPVGTPYSGGVFRVKLVLGSDYPAAPPKGYFMTKIFHPNVSATGDICVNTLKKDWTPDTTLSHVLAVVRCLLIVPFPESSLNDEAGKLFMESYDEYVRKAKLVTEIHAGGAKAAEAAPVAAPAAAAAAAPVALGASKATNAVAVAPAAAAVAKPVAAPAVTLEKKKSMKRL